MTVKEMDAVIQAYCEAIGDDCENCCNCIIRHECNMVFGNFQSDTDICEEAYEKIVTHWKKPPLGTQAPIKCDDKPTVDMVNRPPHYCREGGMECIDEMIILFGKEAVKHFCLCNSWKYRYRAADKNGEEDLKKSDWYIKKYKELVEG